MSQRSHELRSSYYGDGPTRERVTGEHDDDRTAPKVRCSECAGYGDIVDETPVRAGYSGALSHGMYFRACPHCNGTGTEPTPERGQENTELTDG